MIYPETAAAGVWMSVNDLSKILMDLCGSYNNNDGVLLKSSTAKEFFDVSKIDYEKKYNLCYIWTNKNGFTFSHGGWNYGYLMQFECSPKTYSFKIVMTNIFPPTITGDVWKKIDKL